MFSVSCGNQYRNTGDETDTSRDETDITVLRTDPQKHGWERLHSNYGCCNQITDFFFLKIINYSNKLQKTIGWFQDSKLHFLSQGHLRFCNCRVNIHEPLVPQPTRTKMNWCIFYRRPWHVHCYHGAERLWKGKGCSGHGGVWQGRWGVPLRRVHKGQICRQRTMAASIRTHFIVTKLPRRTIMGHFIKRPLIYPGCAETLKIHLSHTL